MRKQMRKAGLSLVAAMITFSVLFTVGCVGGKRPEADSLVDSLSAHIDSLREDTLESVLDQQPMPRAADELFDDFFFNFAGNRKLQRERIDFPLRVSRNGKVETIIPKNAWRIDHFFMRQDYYTLILDSKKQLRLLKDTTVNNVVVEKINFAKQSVKCYAFNRIVGLWKLTGISYHPIAQNKNASFLDFYSRFAVDSAFQVSSMDEWVTFSAPDPDDEFNNITGTMSPEQWPMFKPELIPTGVIYNILYGKAYPGGNQKIFIVRGIANGLELEMNFQKKDGVWKLVKFVS